MLLRTIFIDNNNSEFKKIGSHVTSLIQEYFSISSLKYPDKTCVSFESQKISFKEMELFTNSFAKFIKSKGIQRNSFIPFFIPKSINSIKSILAILKSDCSYIPLDIEMPKDRLISILENSNAPCIIVDTNSKKLFGSLINSQIPLLNIEDFSQHDSSPLCYANLSTDVAYTIYTSGSTGVPKGVMISHQGILDYIDWCVETYELTAKDEISNHAPLYFDNSTFDLYTAFKTGATLHLAPHEINSFPPKLTQWIKQNEISCFFCVPSVMSILSKTKSISENCFPKLKNLIFAGETLAPKVLHHFQQLLPHTQFTNMYGPTEITVDCTYYKIPKEITDFPKGIHIGVVRKNMEIFVRTNDNKILRGPNVDGELLVRGKSVSLGYLNDPQKTKDQFIQNPFNCFYHDPLYCTGDLVTIDGDGLIYFVGRADNQIKFMGYRIELGEIERALCDFHFIKEAVVVFNHLDQIGNKFIAAMVEASDETTEEKIKMEMSQKVPKYMVPKKISIVEQLPKTSNDKFDRIKISKMLFGEK